MINEPWYAVKCLFLHKDLKRRNGKNNFEERILLVKALSFEEAIAKAENEAADYCKVLENVEYLNFCNAFHLFESRIKDKTEVYSLITASDLNKEEYIEKYHDTGGEMTQKTNQLDI
jgi:hypothetical protein